MEVGVGLIAAALLVALRGAVQPLLADRAPFTFVTLGVVLAALIAGWRSGLTALVAGQVLTWYFIIEPRWTFALTDPERTWALVISSLAQLLILLVISLYQREVAKGEAERERRMELLGHALREIDHRTTNNYATVLALIHLQSREASNSEVKAALNRVAERIQAIAAAAERLALRSGNLDRIRLDDHLCELVEQIERGLAREQIEIECDVDEVTASAETATSISIIVNELVTNAIKHAFNGTRSGSVRVIGRAGSTFELLIADNGRGIEAARAMGRTGLGSKLVESFARQIGAEHEIVSSATGTTHRLVIPKLQ